MVESQPEDPSLRKAHLVLTKRDPLSDLSSHYKNFLIKEASI